MYSFSPSEHRLEKTVEGGGNLQEQHLENSQQYEGLLEGSKLLQRWGLVPAKTLEGKRGKGTTNWCESANLWSLQPDHSGCGLWTAGPPVLELPILCSQADTDRKDFLPGRKASLTQLTREIKSLSKPFFPCLVSRRLQRASARILSSLRLHLC